MTNSDDDEPGKRLRETKPRTYQVGYGKPPISHSFKPGQSGNLKGRPKGARNTAETTTNRLLQIVRRDAERQVPVHDGVKTTKFPKSDVVIRTLSNKAMKGELRAIRDWLELVLAADEDQERREQAEALKRAREELLEPEQSPYELASQVAFALRKGLESDHSQTDRFVDLLQSTDSKELK